MTCYAVSVPDKQRPDFKFAFHNSEAFFYLNKMMIKRTYVISVHRFFRTWRGLKEDSSKARTLTSFFDFFVVQCNSYARFRIFCLCFFGFRFTFGFLFFVIGGIVVRGIWRTVCLIRLSGGWLILCSISLYLIRSDHKLFPTVFNQIDLLISFNGGFSLKNILLQCW